MSDLLHFIQQQRNPEEWKEEEFFSMIESAIKDLLERDLSQLFQALYRIDVKETLVKKIFEEANETDDIARQLTVVIIQRIKQKAEWRNKYR